MKILVFFVLHFFSCQSYSMETVSSTSEKNLFHEFFDTSFGGYFLEDFVNDPMKLLNSFDFALQNKRVFSLNQIKNALEIAVDRDKEFDFSHQSFTPEKFKYLFTGNGPLRKVKRLKFLHVRLEPALLSQLPVSLVHFNASELELGYGDLQWVSRLKNLQSLHLSYESTLRFMRFPLTDQEVCHLASMNKIRELSLAGHEIGLEGVRCIAKIKGIKSLNLAANEFNHEAVDWIASQMQGLKVLDLSMNTLYAESAHSISEMKGIESLNFSDNHLYDEGVEWISRMEGLKVLNLSYNHILDNGIQRVAQMQGLKVLDLSHNSIKLAGLQAIGRMEGLEKLVLNSCFNGKKRDRIKALKGVRFLDLSSNRIDNQGAAVIAGMGGIEFLKLNSNDIQDEGATKIAEMVGLKLLDLSSNRIGTRGATAITQMQGLESLDLSRNQVGEAGVRMLLEMTEVAVRFALMRDFEDLIIEDED